MFRNVNFFSDNYISDSTKEELSVIYNANGYEKQNVMLSLVPLNEFDAEKVLVNAVANHRISIPNASDVLGLLTKVIDEERNKTIHRYNGESDIPFLLKKIDKAFNIRNMDNQSFTQKNLEVNFDFEPKGKMLCSETDGKKVQDTNNVFIEGQNENSLKHLLR